MSVSNANKTVFATDTNASSFPTTSITPVLGCEILVWVQSTIASGTNPNTPTVSGNGLTYTLVGSIQETNANLSRLSLFRAKVTSVSAGVITADFAGQSQTTCSIVVDELTQIHPSGTNGSGCIVQIKTAQVSGTNSGISATFDNAFSDPTNATIAAAAIDRGIAITPGSGFADAGNTGGSASSLQAEFRNDNDTVADASWSSGTTRGMMIAVEIRRMKIKRIAGVTYSSIKKIGGVAINSVKKVAGL